MARMRETLLCGFLILLLSTLPAYAGSAQKPPKPAAAVLGADGQGQAGSQQELDAYRKLRYEIDPVVKRNLIEKFAAEFPDSGLLAFVFQEGVAVGRSANNVEIMADYGARSLERRPENYELRTELGSVFVQRDRVDEAETQATRALDLLAIAEKPASVPDPQWEATKRMLLAINHQTLGFVHLRRAMAGQSVEAKKDEAAAAIRSFKRALENVPIDDFTYYGLGFANGLLNDYAEAEWNLAKSVAIDGAVMVSARSLLEQIYKSRHNQSLNGIDLVLAKAKADLGFDN